MVLEWTLKVHNILPLLLPLYNTVKTKVPLQVPVNPRVHNVPLSHLHL